MKILPEDLDPVFMRNYMSRVYNLDALSLPRVQARFISKLGTWLKVHHKSGKLRAKVLDDEQATEKAWGAFSFSLSPAFVAYAASGLVLALVPVVDCCVLSILHPSQHR